MRGRLVFDDGRESLARSRRSERLQLSRTTSQRRRRPDLHGRHRWRPKVAAGEVISDPGAQLYARLRQSHVGMSVHLPIDELAMLHRIALLQRIARIPSLAN